MSSTFDIGSCSVAHALRQWSCRIMIDFVAISYRTSQFFSIIEFSVSGSQATTSLFPECNPILLATNIFSINDHFLRIIGYISASDP